MENLTEKRKGSLGSYGKWDSALKHLKAVLMWKLANLRMCNSKACAKNTFRMFLKKASWTKKGMSGFPTYHSTWRYTRKNAGNICKIQPQCYYFSWLSCKINNFI